MRDLVLLHLLELLPLLLWGEVGWVLLLGDWGKFALLVLVLVLLLNHKGIELLFKGVQIESKVVEDVAKGCAH